MEFTSSPTPVKPTSGYQVNQEGTPLMRKPLSQINNLPNQQSPVIYKKKYGSCHQNLVEECKNQAVIEDHTGTLSSPVSSESSKSSYHNNGGVLPLLIRESSKTSHVPGTSENSTPSPAQRPNILCTPVTASTRLMETPSRPRQGQYTPKSFVTYNPFEGRAEILQLPTVSPSLFKTVVSPSATEDGETDFSWTIDHLALLKPTPIDMSPLQDMEVPIDPEYEKKAQAAIDRFFSSALVVPSPWTSSGSSRSINLVSTLLSSGGVSVSNKLCLSSASPAVLAPITRSSKEEATRPYEVHTPPPSKTHSVWCQTELTLPPVLPKEVEDALAPFCTFTQDQAWQHGEDCDETSALNTTSLRRKLLFSDDTSSSPRPAEASPPAALEGAGEQGSASPASTGPLPLDEELAALPFCASMIRPGSRVSIPRSPASVCVGKSFNSSSSSPGTDAFQVSPVSYVHPAGFRTLTSPASDSDRTPSAHKHFPPSPKFSPILKTPSPLHPEGPHQREKNEQRMQLDGVPSRSFQNGTFLGGADPSGISSRWESSAINDGSPGLTRAGNHTRDSGAHEERGNLDILPRPHMTPGVKECSPCTVTSKASPQFSSSPIKCRGAGDTPGRSDFNRNPYEGIDSPPKFSESPPVSPIAWNFETSRLSPIQEHQSKVNVCHLSFLCSQDSSSGSLSHTKDDDMEDVVEDDGPGDWPGDTRTLDPLMSGSVPGGWIEGRQKPCSSALTRGSEPVSSNSTYMDTDSRPYFEASHDAAMLMGNTLEETSSGQDTGYCTGSSLQTTNTTNQSHFISGHTSSNQTKECKSSLLLSPQEGGNKFGFSAEDVVHYNTLKKQEDVNRSLSPL